MELVDVTDSKSVGLIPRVGSSPTTGTKQAILYVTEDRLFVFDSLQSFASGEVRGYAAFDRIRGKTSPLLRCRIDAKDCVG